MRPFTIAESAVIIWITTVYAFSGDPNRVWISTAAAGCVVAAAVLEVVRRNSIVLNSVLGSRVLFVFFCALTVVGGPATWVTITTLVQIVLVMFAVVNISSGSGSVRAVELGCYAGAAVLLVNAFLEYGLGHSTERYGNLLGNPNTYAFALLSAVLFATRRLLFMRGRGPNFLVQAALVLLVLSASYQVFVGTGSRKGMIGLAAVGVFSVIGSWRLRPRREVLRLALPILVVAGVILAVGSEATRLSRLQSLVEFASGTAIREASASTRASMAREALELWSEKPLAGWGFDQFRYLSARGDYAHSNVLELLANGGLIGMTLYYLAWVYLAKHIVRGWRRSQDREDRLELFWTAFTGLVIACWGFAAVQYEQKLDAVILAALSTIPATVASRCRTRTPRATERHETSFVTCYGVPRT